MLVARRMRKDPVTVTPRDTLTAARSKMRAGKFRRLPVVDGGRLVGIITEGDIREHLGNLEGTRVGSCMSEGLLTVGPQATLEHAALMLLEHKIGGLPVVEDGRLVGIITTSDMLRAFLEVMGASEAGTARIDLLPDGGPGCLAEASQSIAASGGEVLGVGTYRERWGENPVYYLRVRSKDPEATVDRLRREGFNVLGVHA